MRPTLQTDMATLSGNTTWSKREGRTLVANIKDGWLREDQQQSLWSPPEATMMY